MKRRVALIHDWLVGWGGSESVLLSMARLFPDAPIYTAVWHPDPQVTEAFGDREIRPTSLQQIPGSGHFYRHLLPLMPGAFERLDLSEFDLVISSSHAFSKAVRAPEEVPHICYCYTPPRYVWDFVEEERGGLKDLVLRGPVLEWLRARDLKAASGVDEFIADCENVRRRIESTYGRTAEILYPPVDIPAALPEVERGDHFVAGGRLVGYKRVDLAVEAANLTRLPLVVFGEGPELSRLQRRAGPTVSFIGRPSPTALRTLLATARAYLFPGEEDFGLIPVEAQGVGTPVIAYGRGGALETVEDGRTGVFFREQSAVAVAEALIDFEGARFERRTCRTNAQRFARPSFERSFLRRLEALTGQPLGSGQSAEESTART